MNPLYSSWHIMAHGEQSDLLSHSCLHFRAVSLNTFIMTQLWMEQELISWMLHFLFAPSTLRMFLFEQSFMQCVNVDLNKTICRPVMLFQVLYLNRKAAGVILQCGKMFFWVLLQLITGNKHHPSLELCNQYTEVAQPLCSAPANTAFTQI